MPLNNNHPNQISCILCNQTFMSTRALMTHIESHIAHEKVVLQNLITSPNYNVNSQIGQSFQRFHPNIPMPMPKQETINFANDSKFNQTPQKISSLFGVGQIGSSSSSHSIRQIMFPPQPPNQQLFQWKPQENPNDGTKAYIKILEKPIKKIDFVDLVAMDDDNLDVLKLNLGLKL
ncbi:hypothetical protein AAHE18_02G088500 [Arachis hypogaea]